MRNLLPLLAIALSLPLLAAPEGGERTLLRKNAEVQQILDSMIGIRSTLLFLTFGEQQAVLRLHIDNKNTEFPVTGTVYLFDAKTTKEGLAKWLNNQHSDGLFPEVPEPILTTQLPENSCAMTKLKLITDKRKEHNGTFSEYEVTISIKAHQVEGQFSLEAFEAKATVLVAQ